MPQKSSVGRKPRVDDGDILDVFREHGDPVLSTAEVADELPIKRRGTLNRLQQLEDDDVIQSKPIGGRNTVWWLDDVPGDEDLHTANARLHTVADESGADVPGPDRRAPALEGDIPSDVAEALEAAIADEDTHAIPGHVDREAALAAVRASYEYVQENGPAGKSDIVPAVMPEHSLGYDVEEALAKIENEDEQYRGSWWRKVVRPAFGKLEDVKYKNGSGWGPSE